MKPCLRLHVKRRRLESETTAKLDICSAKGLGHVYGRQTLRLPSVCMSPLGVSGKFKYGREEIWDDRFSSKATWNYEIPLESGSELSTILYPRFDLKVSLFYAPRSHHKHNTKWRGSWASASLS